VQKLSTLSNREVIYALFILTGIVFAAAITPIFIRNAQAAGAPSPYIVAVRLLLVTLILTPLVVRRYPHEIRKTTPRTYLWVVVSGMLLATNLLLLFFSLEYVSVLVNTVLRRTSPLWTLSLEMLLLGASVRREMWLAVGLTVAGAAMVALGGGDAVGGGERPVLGAGLALLNALGYAFYFLIGRKLADCLPSLVYSWMVFGVAAVVTFSVVGVMRIAVWGYSLMAYVWILLITFVAQLVVHVGINLGLQFVSATVLSLILQLSVVLSALMALIFFGEVPSTLQVIGSIVLVGAVILGNTLARINRKIPTT
jgi:drug/metabolite transporter (DMT)-like permease